MQGDYNVHERGFVPDIPTFFPRKNATECGEKSTSLCSFRDMWFDVFLWAFISSLVLHLPAALLALATLRRHKMARFFPLAIVFLGIVGPLFGGVLTSAAIAGVYIAAGKKMFSFEALLFGVGQSFFVLIISFLRVLATL